MRRLLAVGTVLALAAGAATASAQTHVQLILDASGSMFAKLPDGRSRIAAAKDVLATLVGSLPEDPALNVGLRVYGAAIAAGEPGACEDSKLVVPMRGLDRAGLLTAVRQVNARGATPIAHSLQLAASDFPTGAGKKAIVLVTDGAESCLGDLKGAVAALKAGGLEVELHVVGIDLNERAVRSFQEVAHFENVTSAAALLAALGRAVPVSAPAATLPVRVLLTRDGKAAEAGPAVQLREAVGERSYALNRGQDGAFTASVPAGAYVVHVEDRLSNPSRLEFPGATVSAGSRNEYSYDLAPPPSVTLTVEGAGTASKPVVVKVEGAPAQAGAARHFVALAVEGSPTGDYLAWAYLNGSTTSVSLRTPDQAARLEARYYVDQAAGGTRLLGRSAPFETVEAKATVSAPAEVQAGSRFEVGFTGPLNSDDYIYLRKEGQGSGFVTFERAGSSGTATLRAPVEPGSYVAVYMLRDREALATSTRVTVTAAKATVNAPAEVQAGSRFEVSFTGPANLSDYIYLRREGQASGFITFTRATAEGKATLQAPVEAGNYVASYVLNDKEAIAVSGVIKVVAAAARVEAPTSVLAGSRFPVSFSGPANQNDYIYLRKEGQTSGFATFERAMASGTANLRAPLEPGNYLAVYVLNDKEAIATSGRIIVTMPRATVTAPAQVKAGERFTVSFTGPANQGDYIHLRKAGATSGYLTYTNAGSSGQATLVAPKEPGEYEVVYMLSDKVVISAPVRIVVVK